MNPEPRDTRHNAITREKKHLTYRVVHVPTSVGGNPQGLSKHLNASGIESETWIFQQNYLHYPADYVLWNKEDGIFLRELKRWKAIFRAACTFDVIHFNFGTSLAAPEPRALPVNINLKKRIVRTIFFYYSLALYHVELNLYRFLKRPLFIHYQGDDARQGDISLQKFRYSVAQHASPGYYSDTSDKFKRKMIGNMEHYCDQIYSVNPDLLHVLPSRAKFMPYCHISLDEWRPVYTQLDTSRPLRIGHAPSNRAVKGTDLILAALENLKAEGFSFELVLVEGVSNEDARRSYEKIDVLVDQLFAGWYGGLAVEAMALGKPVIVYIRDEDLVFIPKDMRNALPFIRVTPDTIKEGLRNVMEMPRAQLLELAKRSREFVEHWHDPVRITNQIAIDYESTLKKKMRKTSTCVE